MHARRRMQAGAQAREDSSLKEKAMKRLHVHVSVNDIPQSVGFYSALFAARPAVIKPDYAKWMLDDPRVNFAISNTCWRYWGRCGVNLDSLPWSYRQEERRKF
jgi:hypothetical protein